MIRPCLVCFSLAISLLATYPVTAAASSEFFEIKIRPILANNCFACHTDSQMGGLRLDSREAMLKGGNSGPAIVPGNAESSLLIQAVRRTQTRIEMPPSRQLKPDEIAALVEWIANGAIWPQSGADLFAKIEPIFAKNCYACHGSMQSGGLRLDSRAGAMKGGTDGPVIVPGKPDESLLIQAVRRTHPRIKMPPSGELSDADIATLVEWVGKGAVWPATDTAGKTAPETYVITPEQRRFWSFQPVHKPEVPTVHDTTWATNEIDRFILARLEKDGLKPVRRASKRVLIRRAYLDMIGLPPTPDEAAAFEKDTSPDAFARVVDRLLASPHYGERWGRYWLDLARYSDGAIGDVKDVAYANAFRYRDWVVKAFNDDMPYDLFLKAQIAGDLLNRPDRNKLVAGLGFYALAPTEVAGVPADDRVDVTGRAILGLTLGCAQCHDHKYDPIPTQDYYSLLGIFRSCKVSEWPLVRAEQVAAYENQKKKIAALQAEIDDFVDEQSQQLSDLLFARTADYLTASWKVIVNHEPLNGAAAQQKLDVETLQRWVTYLKDPNKEHPYLTWWYRLQRERPSAEHVRDEAEKFQSVAMRINEKHKEIDDRNSVKLGGKEGRKNSKLLQFSNLEFLPVDEGYLWRDLASPPFVNVGDGFRYDGGIYYYGKPLRRGGDAPTTGSEADHLEKQIDRWLGGLWHDHLESLRARLRQMQSELPPKYPFLHVLREGDKPADMHVWVRGEMTNEGELAPRRFLRILSTGDPKPFTQGSGRLELANAIASAANPLTARVIANRIWQLHFGQGIVRTPSNFGMLGERPTHPQLLDYLASILVEQGWSIKKLQRLILLSSTYALSSEEDDQDYAKDPDDRLHWRNELRLRLDAEALRDSVLAVAGDLDLRIGGPPVPFDLNNHRRTIYGIVSRTKPDATLALFDFPNPNQMSEQRLVTVGPLQRLWFMNSPFILSQSKLLAERIRREGGPGDAGRIEFAYRLLFGRSPTAAEVKAAADFLKSGSEAWPQYAQVLLMSSEFQSVN